MSEKKRPSTIRRTIHYYWAVTRSSKLAFVGALASTIGYVGFLTYANSYYMGEVVDAVSAGGATLQSLSPLVIALIVVNVLGQA
ncbi:MAG: ABC transporter ATP-binding protein, partial [Olsenella sp.]